MEDHQGLRAPTKAKTVLQPYSPLLMIITLLVFTCGLVAGYDDSRQPFKWTLSRVIGGGKPPQVIQEIPSHGNQTISFITSLCSLVPISPCKNAVPWYACPEYADGSCKQSGQYYCAYWGCESLGDGKPEGGNDRHIIVTWHPRNCTPYMKPNGWQVNRRGGPYCEQLNITIREPGNFGWYSGRKWGFRYNEEGYDRGGFVQIRKLTVSASSIMGPNQVLRPPAPKIPQTPDSQTPNPQTPK